MPPPPLDGLEERTRGGGGLGPKFVCTNNGPTRFPKGKFRFFPLHDRGVLNAKKSCSRTWYFQKSLRTVHAFTPVFPIVQP